MGPTCIPTQFLQICNTHRSASIDPIEDIEDLILYTKKRISSAKDPYTSREIMWVDVGLCHKKLSELQKINGMTIAQKKNRCLTHYFLTIVFKEFHSKVTFSLQSGNTTFLLKNILHLNFVRSIEQIIVTLFYHF